eukprot:15325973-Ditylum_brightwellii.AAC.1
MMCWSKCGNYGHYGKRDIGCPPNAINIKNAQATEEREQKALVITKHNANTKCATNNNNNNKCNNVEHNIYGIQVTMIASSINNYEEEEVSDKEDNFYMPDALPLLDHFSHDLILLANKAMIVREGDVLFPNTSSYVVPMGNKTQQEEA